MSPEPEAESGGASEAELRAEVEELRARLATAEAELEDRKQFVAQVMGAEDRARRRIAQLIHDDALQSLLAANQELQEAAPGRIGVTRAHEVVSATIQHLREAMVSLHPVTLERGGLEQALSAVARQAERQGGFDVQVRIDPRALERHDGFEPSSQSGPSELNGLIVAVARELLANAARHSGAEHVELIVEPVDDGHEEREGASDGAAVAVEVNDDGRGFPAERPREALLEGHIGLASVAQRAEVSGGSFTLESEPGKGTRARAVLLSEPAHQA